MLTLAEKIIFALFAAACLYFAWPGFRNIVLAVRRGPEGAYPRFGNLPARIGGAILRTMGQGTVFKARPVVSFFHALVFYGFVYYLLVNVIDVLFAYVPPAWYAGLSAGWLGNLYRLGADLLTAAVLIGVAWLLVRRFITRDQRLEQRNPETLLHEDIRSGAIRRDSLIVGSFILLHVGFRLVGETFLLASHAQFDPWQPISSSLALLVGYGDGRAVGWHVGFWLALGLILLFLIYFPRSKHLHLFSAPVNFALDRRQPDFTPVPLGVLEPLDLEDETVEQYGAAKLEHLAWPQLLDSYACIQCNRCTEVCPANVTGKVLSPAAMEMNKRYELNSIIGAFAAGEESPRELTEFAISTEAIWACTTCGACMEVCPVGNLPMLDIVDIRRDQVMMKGEFPAELQTAFRGMERAGNPWGLGQDRRLEWADGLDVPLVEDNPGFEVLFFVGCAGSYDPAAQQTTRAMIRILEQARVNYAVLGKNERCTGDPARRAGNEYLYWQLAAENVESLKEVMTPVPLAADTLTEHLDPASPKRVLTTCPHCFNAFANDYPQLGGDFSVMHHTQLIQELMDQGRIPPMDLDAKVTFHDPCYLGRHNGEYEAPRQVLAGAGVELLEMDRSREKSFCCGAGGAQFWKEEEEGQQRVSENRYQEALSTGAEIVATGCPFCKVMLDSADSAGGEGAPVVRDVAQLVADSLDRIQGALDQLNSQRHQA